MSWLLEARTRQKLEEAEKYRPQFSSEQKDYEAHLIEANSGDTPRIFKAIKGVASINVQGVLTKNPDWYAKFFGGGNTTYGEIVSSLAHADANDLVSSIDLHIDSPGGTIEGLFDAVGALQNTKKPIRAIVDGMAASAAYCLASQAGSIIATNKATRFGSIGVVVSYWKSANIYDITSTKAPKKRPDPSTEEGQAVIREELDALHELFVDAIGAGRGVSAKKVNDQFGQGGMYLASEALSRGMIDSIVGDESSGAKTSAKKDSAATGGDLKGKKMDLKTLKAQHPDVYDQALETGVAQERDRVSAHLTAGEISGDMETAIKAAKDGTEMTLSLQTKYMMTAANRSNQKDREADDKTADEALKGTDKTEKTTAEVEREKVAALVLEKLGVGA